MNETKNNHYVGRAQTKAWESELGELWYFDFESDRISKQKSKKLFSRKNIFSDSDELAFNALFEGHLGNYVKRARKTGSTKAESWKEHLALYFLIHLQAPRYAVAVLGIENPDFSALLQFSESELGDCYKYFVDKYRLLILHTNPGESVFFPETGIFCIPTCNIEHPYAISIAVLPTMVIALTRNEIAEGVASEYGRLAEFLPRFSLGMPSFVNKVVIPPELKQFNSDEQIIAGIREHQAVNEGLYSKISQFLSFLSGTPIERPNSI